MRGERSEGVKRGKGGGGAWGGSSFLGFPPRGKGAAPPWGFETPWGGGGALRGSSLLGYLRPGQSDCLD